MKIIKKIGIVLVLISFFAYRTVVYAQLTVPQGGTGSTTIPTGRILFGDTTLRLGSSNALFWDKNNSYLGIGTTTPGAPIHVFTNIAGNSMIFESTSGGTEGPAFLFRHTSASPAVGDSPGAFEFSGRDSAGASLDYADISSAILDPTAGSVDGRLIFSTTFNSSGLQNLDITHVEALFNPESNDTDFRVKGTSEAYLLMADASSNRIGIGSSTPGTLLSLGNTGNNTINIDPTSTSTFGSGINLRTGCYAINGVCVGSGSSFAFPFTPATNFAVNTNSTTTPIWFRGSPFGLMASGTIEFVNASSTGMLSLNKASNGATVIGNTTGNTRGTNALDIQSRRGLLTQIASGDGAVAVGNDNTATGLHSSTLGYINTASSYFASASGYGNTASGNSSSAFGFSNIASGSQGSSAVGWTNTASDLYASAFGFANLAGGAYTSAFGKSNMATGGSSSAFGYQNTASGNYSVSLGYTNIASGATYNSAVGINNTASGSYNGDGNSTAYGFHNTVLNYNSAAFGNDNQILGAYNNQTSAVALGVSNTTNSLYAPIAVGISNSATSDYSDAFGQRNTASGGYSQAFGSLNIVSGDNANGFGNGNTASGGQASAFGNGNIVSNIRSVAFGRGNNATGTVDTVVGQLNSVGGDRSSAFGASNTVYFDESSAFGNNIVNNLTNATQIGPSDTAKVTIISTGNTGIGTTSPATKLDINGTVTIEGTKNCSSLGTNNNGLVTCSTGISGVATSTASLRNKTATVSNVNSLTPTASSTYAIYVSTDVKAISAGTLTVTCTYTNTNGVSSTATFFPMGLTSAGLTTTGSPSLTPLIITPMKNTAVTVVATFVGVSISYDIDASILPVGSAVN